MIRLRIGGAAVAASAAVLVLCSGPASAWWNQWTTEGARPLAELLRDGGEVRASMFSPSGVEIVLVQRRADLYRCPSILPDNAIQSEFSNPLLCQRLKAPTWE